MLGEGKNKLSEVENPQIKKQFLQKIVEDSHFTPELVEQMTSKKAQTSKSQIKHLFAPDTARSSNIMTKLGTTRRINPNDILSNLKVSTKRTKTRSEFALQRMPKIEERILGGIIGPTELEILK